MTPQVAAIITLTFQKGKPRHNSQACKPLPLDWELLAGGRGSVHSLLSCSFWSLKENHGSGGWVPATLTCQVLRPRSPQHYEAGPVAALGEGGAMGRGEGKCLVKGSV